MPHMNFNCETVFDASDCARLNDTDRRTFTGNRAVVDVVMSVCRAINHRMSLTPYCPRIAFLNQPNAAHEGDFVGLSFVITDSAHEGVLDHVAEDRDMPMFYWSDETADSRRFLRDYHDPAELACEFFSMVGVDMTVGEIHDWLLGEGNLDGLKEGDIAAWPIDQLNRETVFAVLGLPHTKDFPHIPFGEAMSVVNLINTMPAVKRSYELRRNAWKADAESLENAPYPFGWVNANGVAESAEIDHERSSNDHLGSESTDDSQSDSNDNGKDKENGMDGQDRFTNWEAFSTEQREWLAELLADFRDPDDADSVSDGELNEHGLFRCDHCGEIETMDKEHDVDVAHNDTEEWCDGCVDDDASWCEHGQHYVDNDHHGMETVRTGGGYWDTEEWCDGCIEDGTTLCDDCNELLSDDYAAECTRTVWVGGGVEVRVICDSCLGNYYYICEGCGALVNENDAVYDEDRDCVWCPDCYDSRHSEYLHSYGHTDATVFKDTGKDDNFAKMKLYLGIECETECVDTGEENELAKDVTLALGEDLVECKEDGSLTNGCEIVSQPFTPLYHLNSGFWETVFEKCNDHGARSYDGGNCGLHIHVSRSFLDTDDSVYRLDRLVMRFPNQWTKFSQRQSWFYCRLKTDADIDVKANDTNDVKRRKWDHYTDKWNCHHRAVNLGQSATIELRLWRGCITQPRFYATVEMTTAMALVAKRCSTDFVETCTWGEFVDMARDLLDQTGMRRTELDEYLVHRHLASSVRCGTDGAAIDDDDER